MFRLTRIVRPERLSDLFEKANQLMAILNTCAKCCQAAQICKE
jgi:hypothetical protein